MSAAEESSLSKLGVIAGGGVLPQRLLQACDKRGRSTFVVGFEGQTTPDTLEGREYLLTHLGAGGKIIDTLKAHGIRDIVLIGSIRRPSFTELKPDLRTAGFFAKIAMKALGDDSLLKALRAELEAEGFTVHGIQNFAADLCVAAGTLGKCRPRKEDWTDINRGLEIVSRLGSLDIGQAAIVQEGIVLGVEAAEGTDELIRRCGNLKRKGRGGVLIKLSKPGQDEDLDLPTIGPQTVRLCAENGFTGIVLEAGRTLLLDEIEVRALADEHKIFVLALNQNEVRSHAA